MVASVGKESGPLVLGLAGFGTVGGGVVKMLNDSAKLLEARCGRKIVLKRVLVRDTKKIRLCPLPAGCQLTTDAQTLVADPEIDVLVELLGGIKFPKELIASALKAGKHVVTANKALLAEDGADLFALAAEHNRHLAFEASVCGGIPIVDTLKTGLSGNNILSLSGILNGTSNFILSAMTSMGQSFEEALKNAQELGFAEADPTLDVEGLDAAHKLTVLIRLAWGVDYPFKDLPVRGIAGLDSQDIQFAREFGYRIKLLGQAVMQDGRLEAGVFPTLVPDTFLLARVGHSYNAVRVEGDAVGSVFLHGRGAGDLPTGSAVVSDILRIASGALPNNSGFIAQNLPRADILPPGDAQSPYYLRLVVLDQPGVLRDVASALAEHNISVAQAIQKGQQETVPLMFMTHKARAKDVTRALEKIKSFGFLREEPVSYRVLERSAGQ